VSYPVRFEADYAARRDRLSVLVRLVLLIPLALLLLLYAVAGGVAIVVAWFAIVITARYPAALYEFVAGYARFLTRVTAYAILLCDAYPPFSGDDSVEYPVRLTFAGPLERYSRWRTLFRPVLAIPLLIVRYMLTLVLALGAAVSWLAIVVTGELPPNLFDLMAQLESYVARSDGFLFLMTETYPPFDDRAAAEPA
jgi:hypothetical protein